MQRRTVEFIPLTKATEVENMLRLWQRVRVGIYVNMSLHRVISSSTVARPLLAETAEPQCWDRCDAHWAIMVQPEGSASSEQVIVASFDSCWA
jgi:hypothetical protein